MGIEQFIKKASTILQPHQRAWFCTFIKLKEKIFASAVGTQNPALETEHFDKHENGISYTLFFKDEDTTFILQLPQSHYY
jgi:non-specific serine/threonine protein kinase